MRSLKNRILLVAFVSVSLASGCGQHGTHALKQSQDSAWGEPPWGPQAEGLQCRLRPTRSVWRAGQTPTFKVDLRNRGKRIFAFLATDPIPVHEFVVDGRRYRLVSPSVVQGGHVQPLAPGAEFSNLPADLPGQVHLAPGRHAVCISFQFEGIEVVSNPVGIEILHSR